MSSVDEALWRGRPERKDISSYSRPCSTVRLQSYLYDLMLWRRSSSPFRCRAENVTFLRPPDGAADDLSTSPIPAAIRYEVDDKGQYSCADRRVGLRQLELLRRVRPATLILHIEKYISFIS